MRIEYDIKEVIKNVFAVIVPDDYDRAMLFLRVQEFSESPNSAFRGHTFDMWEYVKWYSEKYNNGEGFSYPLDWSGFNVSLETALRCYNMLPFRYTTEYDIIFRRILQKILKKVPRRERKDVYLISFDKMGSRTMRHEMHHAHYFTSKAYRKAADALARKIPKVTHKKLRRNLHAMGYYSGVMRNELQAYLRGREWRRDDISKGIDKSVLKNVHDHYKKTLEKIEKKKL